MNTCKMTEEIFDSFLIIIILRQEFVNTLRSSLLRKHICCINMGRDNSTIRHLFNSFTS